MTRPALSQCEAAIGSPWEPMPDARTVPGLLHEMAERFPDRDAIVAVGRRYTYASLLAEVRRFAKGLHALGIRRGDKVAILMGNKPEWLVADLAITYLGAVMVAVNTWVTTRELAYILKHSDTAMLVVASPFLKYDYMAMLTEMEPLAASLPCLRKVIHLGAGREDSIAFADVYGLGAEVPDAAIEAAREAIDPRDVTYFLYTSGSTSTPKGVQIQHFGLIENMWGIGERMHVTHRDRLWLAVSLYWGLGCENALFNLFTHGGCIVLQEHFEPAEALRLIEEERCTLFYGTPNMVQALAEHPDRARRDLSSLRSGGTLGTREQMLRAMDLGMREVCQIYGLTETYGNCCVTDSADSVEIRCSTVGRPLQGVTLRIADAESGRELSPGEVGEIRVKGYVTCGYYKDEDKNRDAFDADGFFRTGDLGMLDEAGYLQFRGRIKEMIKTGGINVAPAEVEEVLMAHAAVHLAYVVGVPDAARDEVIGAVVVLREGSDATEADLAAHCRREIAAYKLPRLYHFAREAELPLTNTGKLQKNQLHRLFGSPRGAAVR